VSNTDDTDPEDTRSIALAASGVLGAGLAHELRNTLASAESAIFLARRDASDEARLLRHLDHAELEIRRSQEMIGRVLVIARGEPLPRESTLLADVVASVDRDFGDGHAKLETNVPADLELFCEPLLLERVLTNLVRNADEAGATRVVLRASVQGKTVSLEVEDDGPGFSDVMRARLFEPLATNKSSGTGLGLALCRLLVRAHGGTIEALSGTLGGALVRIVLPTNE